MALFDNTDFIEKHGLPLIVLVFWILLINGVLLFPRENKSKGDSDSGNSNSNSIPMVHGLPIIGVAKEYFGSPFAFIMKNRKKFGNTFYCNIFNKKWLFILAEEDVKIAIRASDNVANFLEAYRDLGRLLLPVTQIKKSYPDDVKKKIDDRQGSAHIIANSVRTPIIKAWIPSVRKIVQDTLAELPNGNEQQLQIDLFEFARVSISRITVVYLMGESTFTDDKSFLQKWTDLFEESDIDRAFSNPYSAMTTMVMATLTGERGIYAKIRNLLFPLIDKEIDECIAGNPLKPNPSFLSSSIRYRFDKEFKKDEGKIRMARDRIANDLFAFSFAAFSNSFAGAAWAIYHILRDTNGIGTRIRSEIENGPEDAISPTLQNTIMEITRLYTPGQIIRKVRKPLKLSDGKQANVGDMLAISTFISLREGYTNPLSFDPDRFERGEHKGRLTGFGGGCHLCPGKNFAMLEISIFVQESLKCNFKEIQIGKMDSTGILNKRDRDPQLKDIIDIEDHPNLELSQAGFLWRPSEPVMVTFER